MSKARKCDRCGNFFDVRFDIITKDDRYDSIFVRPKDSRSRDIDLCPSCMKELVDWLDMFKDTDKEERK